MKSPRIRPVHPLALAVLTLFVSAAAAQEYVPRERGGRPNRVRPPVSAGAVQEVSGPSSSLFGDRSRRGMMTLADCSYTHSPPRDAKTMFKLNDMITVLVDEKAVMSSEGEVDRKKKASVEAVLKDWVLLKGLTLFPDPQSAGDPKISAKLDNKMKSQGSVETRDLLKFHITCSVVDIYPNGNLVLEGHDSITNNEEVWNYSFSGIIRPMDVTPDNTITSEKVLYKRIDKRESGHVRDGYRRGWFLKWLDKYQPW